MWFFALNGRRFGLVLAVLFLFFSQMLVPNSLAQGAPDLIVYADGLNGSWQDWSWGSSVDLASGNPVHAGTQAIATTYNEGWAGLYLHANDGVDSYSYTHLTFWLHGGNVGNQAVNVMLLDGAGNPSTAIPITATANQWEEHRLTLADFGAPAIIGGIIWQDGNGNIQPTFHIDEIHFIYSAPPSPPPSGNATHFLNVDMNTVNHEISPYIYGGNFTDETFAREIGLPVNRWGGNATTRYNWQLDVGNKASDWFFENIPNTVSNILPANSTADQFVDQNNRTGTETLLTIPIIGWTPKSDDITCGYSVSQYGQQDAVDPWRPDCGNGMIGGVPITNNNPNDTSLPIDETFIQDWMSHLATQFGSSAPRFYSLDNEPMLWNHTHRDVHPDPVGYDELWNRSMGYASAIKATDPQAEIVGPALWGWTAYFYSGIDVASGNYSNPPDRNAHDGTPFVEWYLQQMANYEQNQGTRLLDYLDLHYYPQQSGVTLGTAGNLATQRLRLRSTRALWDPTYTDESWINEPVRLIPRMHEWVDNSYAGTKLALTEYNWGGLEHINGAVTQADVLGIFGREDLHMANIWGLDDTNSPAANAFRIYRNYNGLGGQFGNLSLPATSNNQDELAIYASANGATAGNNLQSYQKITLVIVNKSWNNLTTELTLSDIRLTTQMNRFEYSGSNLQAIVAKQPVSVTQGVVTTTFPAQSITLLELVPLPTSLRLSSAGIATSFAGIPPFVIFLFILLTIVSVLATPATRLLVRSAMITELRTEDSYCQS